MANPALNFLCAAALLLAAGARADAPPARPALVTPIAAQAMVLGAALAGPRSVAVGEHGIVMLSDDGGATQRQASSVPVRSLLTAVDFIDDKHGWAVGHHGVVLASHDGGESWQVQRRDVSTDRPLFAVHFFDARQGVAVGLWGLILVTDDGGKTWAEQAPPPAPNGRRADYNLLGLFADAHGRLFATAERGLLLRSDDRGHSWQLLETGYAGSFWTGAALDDGSLLAAGQRGNLYRSDDDGRSWQRVALNSKSSVTAIARHGADVLAVGLDGLVARSGDGGRTFATTVREDGMPLTAALHDAAHGWRLWSRRGAVAAEAPKP
jgi:photosystem II stability/assembly factor-like uncharacterized protein